MIIRREDTERSLPDLRARHIERLHAELRRFTSEEEGKLLWQLRRSYALAILAGWRPPTARQLWWRSYEDDALDYAATFEPD